MVKDPRQDVPFDILIAGYAPAYAEKVRDYLTLLGLQMPLDESKDIILPVYFAVKGGASNGVSISTRSTFGIIEILRASIEVPQEHAVSGIALNYPPPGLPGKNIRIHSSKDKPDTAVVAVKHHGYWFYIDENDMHTKLFYNLVRMLWSVSIASTSDRSAAPILTIPVGQ